MPVIKLKHIVSFSSEDPAHPAENLLKSEIYRKWQCADPSEKQASVVIELDKATKIKSVDIGNNGSAFVEVLVGRSSSSEYQVLLVASSFMSPAESKSGTNNNRVRMFGLEKLSKSVSDQKWDRVKLVCTQPYTKSTCYGVSFVNFHAPECTEKNETQGNKTKLGAFVLKDEVGDTITSGSFFAKRKEKTEVTSSQSKSTAAELREASKHPAVMSTTSSTKLNFKPENSERKKELATPSSSKRKAESAVVQSKPTDIPKVSSKEKVQPPVKKAKVVTQATESGKREIAINQILKDVIFVLSGFKNPERGNLRDKAVSMGARYRGDWDQTCTHLICAFINTPKYCQVKATRKGKIVSQKWVHDCLSKKKRLPERRFKLRGDDSDDSSTEEETEISAVPKRDKDRPTTSNAGHDAGHDAGHVASPTPQLTTLPKSTSQSTPAPVVSTPDKTNDTKDEIQENKEIIENELSDSGHDTEDEKERVMKDDPYNCSTEYETDDGNDDIKKDITNATKSSTMDLINLPDFFSNKTFFLYGEFDSEERRNLIRYITAYDGNLEEYMSDNVKYVITSENWNDDFNEALIENSLLTFVRPEWIYACNEKQLCVPFQPYIVVPR